MKEREYGKEGEGGGTSGGISWKVSIYSYILQIDFVCLYTSVNYCDTCVRNMCPTITIYNYSCFGGEVCLGMLSAYNTFLFVPGQKHREGDSLQQG